MNNALQVSSGIKDEVNEIIEKIHKKEISVDKPGRAINSFPQVQRLGTGQRGAALFYF